MFEKEEEMVNEEYDPSGMKDKIRRFPDQIMSSWKNGQFIKMEKPINLVVSGMGGSAIAGDLLEDLLFENLKIPLHVNRGYDLPFFVNEQTLLLISSYSGNTEETICAFSEGLKRKAQIVVFTSNGEMEKIAEKEGIPVIKFPTGYPPRSALGFSFFSMLGFIKNLLDIPLEDKAIESLIQKLRILEDSLFTPPNKITELAESLVYQIPIIYVTRKLKSVALRWQTQINENSKTFSHINFIPEANHNEIVGLEYPKKMIKQMHLILLRSEYFENKQIEKRFSITEDLLKNFVGNITTITGGGNNKLEDMFTLIYKGDFLSYYLSQILKVDPTPVKRIDSLKERLKG